MSYLEALSSWSGKKITAQTLESAIQNKNADERAQALKFLKELSGESGVEQYIKKLDTLLADTCFIVGFQLSAADVAAAAFVRDSIQKGAKGKKATIYNEAPNVCRWFDCVQHQIPQVIQQVKLLQEKPKSAPTKQKKHQKSPTKNKTPATSQDKKTNDKKETKSNKKQKQGGSKKSSGNFKVRDYVKEIDFVQERVKLFEEIYNRQQAERSQDTSPIKITLPDGTVKPAVKNQTTPMDIAKGISKGLSKRAVIAKVDGVLWDLPRPFEGDCKLEILTFNSEEGNEVFWHSSSHVLGQSLERLFKGKLTIGPALDKSEQLSNGGFYYDVDTGDATVSENHYKEIENMMTKIAREKQEFFRIVMTKDEALQMFKENSFKQQLINEKIPDGETCTAYRCGPLVDLCRGPHIPSTGIIKAMQVVKNSATYWKGNADNPSLTRVYGISFPDNKLMKKYKANRKKAQENDHRLLGRKYKLFFFDEISPGSCFWLPHGTRLYNKLIAFIREQYVKRGYSEVITPNVFDMKLWETSGHAAKYRENMFLFECEGTEFGLKPMNCPGHCCLFKHDRKSYRDLPQRIADFGVLHRNEISGSLTGLTRVRRFQQDDAHIFCRADQIQAEVKGVLDFLDYVYSVFGFTFEVELSTRPENKLGTDELWDKAESALATVLTEFCEKHKDTIKPWKENAGDGAFYGPKIDIGVFDCMGRQFQCGTVQLDFQLPLRFELEYATADNKYERPVMVHRAILGSVERFSAILIEHFGGKLPFWCSPRQMCVVPIHEDHLEYARKIASIFEKEGYFVEVDDSNDRFKKKVRNAQIMAHNMILVVGGGEIESESVNIRLRNGEQLGIKTIEEAKEFFKELNDSKTRDY